MGNLEHMQMPQILVALHRSRIDDMVIGNATPTSCALHAPSWVP